MRERASVEQDRDGRSIPGQVELLDLCVERFQTDAKNAGRRVLIPTDKFQDAVDMGLLNLPHADGCPKD